MKARNITLLSLGAATLLGAQEAQINYVRESARFTVTSAWGTDNPIDVFATDAGADYPSDNGLSFADFNALLAGALAEGRGGILNFDNPVYGGPYLDYDRTAVRAYIQQAVEDATVAGTNFDEQPVLKAFQDAMRAEAESSGLVDFSEKVPVVNRVDPSNEDPSLQPQSETLLFAKLVAVFGTANERQIEIERGPLHYREGALATFEDPAAEDLSTVNDQYFFEVGRSGYANPVPTSLPFSFNSGMADLRFDARDNITALGFTALSCGNFQYWQGLSALPDRPGNLQAVVTYSDGSTALLQNTTRQSSGGHDIFFAVSAPEGLSITALNLRAVGRNWRTFTFIDDFAFITEPGLPYVSNAMELSGAVGAAFYHRLETGQNPDSVAVSGLPQGLSFDSETLLISGTPTVAGDYSVDITLENSVGAQTETLALAIAAQADADGVPQITNASALAASVTLGQSLAPLSIQTNLDGVVLPGSLEYFTIVYRLSEDGSRTLTTLDATGLGLAGGVLSGTPGQPSQVGNYEVEVYVRNANGGDMARLQLGVFPVVPVPNFDGDTATDIIWRDLQGGTLKILSSALGFNAGAIDTGIGDAASAYVGFGDIDGNNHADIFAYTANADSATLRYYAEDMAAENLTVPGLASGWSARLVADLRGDGGRSVLLENSGAGQWAVWHFLGDELAWAGLWYTGAEAQRVLRADGDFDGNGVRDLIFELADGSHEIVAVSTLTGTGSIEYASEAFVLPDNWSLHSIADFSGEGSEDILLKNSYTGEFAIWYMSGPTVPEAYRLSDGEEGFLPAAQGTLPGTVILQIGSPYEVVAVLDVNEDQKRDLLLQHRETQAYALQIMDAESGPVGLDAAYAAYRVEAVGDYNADKRLDILLRNPDNGDAMLAYLGPQGSVDTLSLGVLPVSGVEFIATQRLSRDLSLPPGRNDPLVPFMDATILGGRWFELDWFGQFYDPAEPWIYHIEHGYLEVASETTDDLWLYDNTLGWLWTTNSYYPWMYHERNLSWIYYMRGTRAPRWFFDYFLFFDWVTENDL